MPLTTIGMATWLGKTILTTALGYLVKEGLEIFNRRFRPDGRHEETLCSFRQLDTQIGRAADQIKHLEKLIKLELAGQQCARVAQRIQLGLEYCLGIGKGIAKAEIDNQDRLIDLCSNQKMTLALDALVAGMAGEGRFRESILDNLYDQTKGDRPKIMALTNRLEQLVCGGLIVLATYEMLVRGEEGAKSMTSRYGIRLKAVTAKVESIISRCQDNFRDQMLNELNAILDTGRPNKDLVTEVSNFMSKKYDWLENFCLVYNDMLGHDKHAVGGFRVESYHRNGKCGIVFYRTIGDPPKFSNRYDEANKINGAECKHAREGFKNIVAELCESGIGFTGCAVVKVGHNLSVGGTFSTKICSDTGENATSIILLM